MRWTGDRPMRIQECLPENVPQRLEAQPRSGVGVTCRPRVLVRRPSPFGLFPRGNTRQGEQARESCRCGSDSVLRLSYFRGASAGPVRAEPAFTRPFGGRPVRPVGPASTPNISPSAAVACAPCGKLAAHQAPAARGFTEHRARATKALAVRVSTPRPRPRRHPSSHQGRTA